jgi:hypothetical protein
MEYWNHFCCLTTGFLKLQPVKQILYLPKANVCNGKKKMERSSWWWGGWRTKPNSKVLLVVLIFQKRSCRFKNKAVHAKSMSIIPGKILNTTINQKNESFTIASFAISYSPFCPFFAALSPIARALIIWSEPWIKP